MIEKKELFESYEKVITELALLENRKPLNQLDKKRIKVLHQKKQVLRNSVLVSGAEEIVGSFSVKNKQLVQAEEGFSNFPQADGNYAVIQIK